MTLSRSFVIAALSLAAACATDAQPDMAAEQPKMEAPKPEPPKVVPAPEAKPEPCAIVTQVTFGGPPAMYVLSPGKPQFKKGTFSAEAGKIGTSTQLIPVEITASDAPGCGDIENLQLNFTTVYSRNIAEWFPQNYRVAVDGQEQSLTVKSGGPAADPFQTKWTYNYLPFTIASIKKGQTVKLLFTADLSGAQPSEAIVATLGGNVRYTAGGVTGNLQMADIEQFSILRR